MIQNSYLQELHAKGYEVYEHRWLTPDDFKMQLGFTEHAPRIFRKWVRTIGESENGTALQLWNDTVYLKTGHYMVYDPSVQSDSQIAHPDQLSHWPVDPIEFARSYDLFPMQVFPYEMIDIAQGKVGDMYLNPVEYLIASIGGFVPVYKSGSVWAKIVKSPTAILGLEHTDQPTEVPIGAVLALGISGEPYFMPRDKFHRLYQGDLF